MELDRNILAWRHQQSLLLNPRLYPPLISRRPPPLAFVQVHTPHILAFGGQCPSGIAKDQRLSNLQWEDSVRVRTQARSIQLLYFHAVSKDKTNRLRLTHVLSHVHVSSSKQHVLTRPSESCNSPDLINRLPSISNQPYSLLPIQSMPRPLRKKLT